MADFNIKEEYNKLKDKYKLPSFDNIDGEFELLVLEKKGFVLRLVRRRMNEKAIFFCNIIERILYPNPQFIPLMHESKFLDSKKDDLFKLYKKLMSYERRSVDLDVRSSKEKEDADFIKDLFKDWNEFKEKLTDVTGGLSKFWLTEYKEKKEGEAYFG